MNRDNKLYMNGNVTQQGSHMIMTNVYKPTRKKYINIDSRFHDGFQSECETKSGLASFTYTLPNIVFDVKSISVRVAEIPNCLYNFSQHNQNTFFTVNGELRTIADGFYDADGLIAALNYECTNDYLTFSLDDISKQITIDNTDTDTDSGAETIICWGVDSKGNDDRYFLQSKLGWALGFRNVETVVPSSNTSLSESILDLVPFKYMFLVVDDFLKCNPGSFTSPMFDSHMNKSVLARLSTVPNTFAFHSPMVFSIESGTLVSDKREYIGKSNLQRMKLELVNEYGKVIALKDMPVSFCLEVEYE